MLLMVVNALFAGFCLQMARFSLRRARPFVGAGWHIIATETRKPDYRVHVESRRQIGLGSGFLIAGLSWGIGALIALIAALAFATELLRLSF